ncbi:molybdenum ABC transporter ATP-binding protein [Roseobacter sp. HKCCD9010]|uniref:molybdenum ABC transporter ATP-binding protein n=1 Tax=unclassified Roseobacter TaxID=196798 RepID=UPI001491657F|nr:MULTISPECIES: molybdenum ABC transporter ATP-binding protein [unclassified Roseobacter]MBF9048682.1 molybdenum ABC transporter ATP-binding protein [Rhodobacterales bacterium HKCCD4356]NNV10681.1 molybdenum ABC transporter ATP-binding protein [Roseobacter sp. HKCCD7357]NNV14866.1 molybdenum ABC transporter ATP-binding protein [Roseobacter sp. HKCCD8768]NNV24325.1 molybdenum ABC transporter ATP-binding protein [Roseobacter sp. HKCCD8192]NNV28582.1 molybdenum ABC transporter ATP-binding protei
MNVHLSFHHRFPDMELALNCTIPNGVTAFFGPSGAGKTSVLRVVAGLETPDEGVVEIGDHRVLDTDAKINVPTAARRIGYVFQEPRLFPHLSVAANLRYGQARSETRALPLGFDDLVALLGLDALLDRRPATLSGGEGQRVALGRALLSGPDLLLMDEPLSALDARRKAELLPYFERLRDQLGLPILYVSHDVAEVTRLADTIVLMEKGQMRSIGPAAEIIAGGETGSQISRDLAGAILNVTIAGHDPTDGLTEARIGSQPIWLPGQVGAAGDQLRVRLDARDVMLMREAPQGISALNVLPVTVVSIVPGPGSGALVRLDHQGQILVARVTKRSVRALALAPGMPLHAIVKSMSVTPERVGTG